MCSRTLSSGMRVIVYSMVVALALASPLVLAQTPSVMVRGQGAMGCGQWVNAIAQDNQTRLTPADTYKSWVLGYLSGMAAGTSLNFWGRAGINQLDSESVFLWIGNYCRANPLKVVFDAADELFLERCRAPDLPCR
jgi:hypothetical protein